MAITTPEKRRKHIHGLVQAAEKIWKEEQEHLSSNFGPQIGSTVTVQLFNGRQIRGVVKAILETTAGRRFQISSGDVTVTVEEKQILEWQ